MMRKSTIANTAKNNSMKSFTLGQNQETLKSEKQLKKEEKQKKKLKKFKDRILKNLNEVLEDIENIHDEITQQALDHFNPKDIILTYGQSDILTSFLKYAYLGGEPEKEGERLPGAKDFEVLVCETAPMFSGHITAKNLMEQGL
jgi:translation initiation factor 2B subunit (eIF-2B alpha/beta/delta family)